MEFYLCAVALNPCSNGPCLFLQKESHNLSYIMDVPLNAPEQGYMSYALPNFGMGERVNELVRGGGEKIA